MEVVVSTMNSVVSNVNKVFQNSIFTSMLGVFLVLYASLAAPKLPSYVARWFDNMWFKLLIMFLIAYMSTRNPSVAIISALALLITLQTLSMHKTTDTVLKAVQHNNDIVHPVSEGEAHNSRDMASVSHIEGLENGDYSSIHGELDNSQPSQPIIPPEHFSPEEPRIEPMENSDMIDGVIPENFASI